MLQMKFSEMPFIEAQDSYSIFVLLHGNVHCLFLPCISILRSSNFHVSSMSPPLDFSTRRVMRGYEQVFRFALPQLLGRVRS